MMAPKIVGFLLLAPVLLLAILFFRAEVYFPKTAGDAPCNATHTPIAGDQIVHRFAKALTIQTITRGNQDYDGAPRLQFARFLATSKNFHFGAIFLVHICLFPKQTFPPFTPRHWSPWKL